MSNPALILASKGILILPELASGPTDGNFAKLSIRQDRRTIRTRILAPYLRVLKQDHTINIKNPEDGNLSIKSPKRSTIRIK